LCFDFDPASALFLLFTLDPLKLLLSGGALGRLVYTHPISSDSSLVASDLIRTGLVDLQK
jgi:hypothetical protein